MFEDMTFKQYTEHLSSSEPVPGGGGASAYAGCLGTALASMVACISSKKEKFACCAPLLESIADRAEKTADEFLKLSELDAQVFLPLSKAYAIPADSPERGEILENALKSAAEIPYKIMQTCIKALELHAELLGSSSKLVISDIGTGAALIRGALEGAFLNVTVNTKLMHDRAYADGLNKKAAAALEEGRKQAEKIYSETEKYLWT